MRRILFVVPLVLAMACNQHKEELTKATFALYKKHGANPVAGCLPALIQLPIFVGLWQALNSSVALRHSPFLWISDLSRKDPLFLTPVLFGLSMLLTQRMTVHEQTAWMLRSLLED